ncbi:hypothetical protein EMPS_06956 [Entomortierella parvispora]|uniref:FIST domain-containing protein n=1 Tax=Entomortierella parvispora TaxID=205924 RepID=A0A9P3HDZ5_9FUNG|nr:hypothetical protein EMPS_06956 [Entomortierella parvispora]
MLITRFLSLAPSLTTRGQARSRPLYTAATCSHPDLKTALARCFPVSSAPAAGSVTVILASRSFPGSDLLDLPSKVPSHITKSSLVLGAVIDRVPTTSGHGVSTLIFTPSSGLISSTPFCLSGQESRRKRLKEKSVGRWARSQDIEERSLDTADAWNAFKSISIGRNQVQVPDAVVAKDKTDQDILVISDLEVHQFLEALDVANPKASKFGLIASSTPFITGRPVTMFYDGKWVQDGVVGVSLAKKQAEGAVKNQLTTVEYPSMTTLGPAMQITRCRGNIILELDESNATRLLLDRLKATTLTKDKEYFLATGPPSTSNSTQEDAQLDMKKATVYKITGGDPSKGNMAVDTVHDLEVGQWVQFIHHSKSPTEGHFDPASEKDAGRVRFTTSDPNNTIEEQFGEVNNQAPSDGLVRKVFGGSSENGFIVGLPGDNTWVCTVADSVVEHSL